MTPAVGGVERAGPLPGPWRLGVDVGGTRLKLGAVAVATPGAVAARAVVAMDDGSRSAAGLVAAIVAGAEALTAACGAAPCGAGVGIPGVLDGAGATVLQSPNLGFLDGVALPALVEAALGIAVRADNDANCVGWGEAVAGAGRGAARQVCLAIGTGLGGAIILDGRLERGARGRAGELGHLPGDPAGRRCGCGGRGCLEQLASQTGLIAEMADVGQLGVDEPPADAVRRLVAAARAGQPWAMAIVARAVGGLGDAIGRLHALLDLERVVIAGGLGAAMLGWPAALEAAAGAACARAGLPAIVGGALGVDAGIIGAAWLGQPAAGG